MKPRFAFALALLAPLMMTSIASSAPKGLDADHRQQIDRAVAAGIELQMAPGAVVVAGRHDGVAFIKAYGHYTYDPSSPAVTTDTVYDLASLSKTIGTATSVMKLIDEGRIGSVTDPASKYLPGMATADKKGITIEQLLLHRAGFVADNSIKDYSGTPEQAIEKIYSGPLKYKPGTDFIYSDVGFIVLGELVKAVSGQPLNVYAKQHVFEPMGMKTATYVPPESWHDRIAPTEKRKGEWMQGVVHDPRAFALGGVAGHAGLFGSGDDVARYCRMMLGKGVIDGKRILKPETVAAMTRPQSIKDPKDGTVYVRGYGVDIDTKLSASPRGRRFEKLKTFGHTGYTGTSLWIDPQNDAFVVLLTNRVHPDDDAEIGTLRKRIATIVADGLLGPKPTTDTASGAENAPSR
jgi:CubicO group peptidase (beta-lactamase class C family)